MPRSRHVVAACLNETWAMDEQKLEQIVGFLELRADGQEISEEHIRAAIAQQSYSVLATEDDEHRTSDGRLVIDGVQVQSLFGTMAPRMNLMMSFSGGTSTQKFGQDFDRGMADDDVKTILIEVDSPGGVVSGTEELRQKIFAARGQKRVVAVARGLIASASYYVGSAAEELVATPSTQVGSIGVYAITNERTELYEEIGVKFFVWRAGDLKASGNPYEKLTEERSKALQARVDAPYAMFVSAVAENRGVSEKTVLDTFGQGTTFVASEALSRNMIDRVAAIEEVFSSERNAARPQQKESSTFLFSTNQPSQALPATKESDDMKIKAALFARGLISSMEASDEVVQAALSGFFRGNVPKTEEEVLAGLNGGTATPSNATPPADNVVDAHQKEMAEAKEATAKAERQRVQDLQAKAALLAETGFVVSEDDIQKAIDEGTSLADAANHWTSKAPDKGHAEDGVTIRPTGSDADKFIGAASDALLMQSLPSVDHSNMPAASRSLATQSQMQIVRQDMQRRGLRASGDNERDAKVWLKSFGEFDMFAGDPAGVHASEYPNLLAHFTDKRLAAALRMQPTTYRRWCSQETSVGDLNPRLVLGQSDIGRLDELEGDDASLPEGKTSEAALAWFKPHRRGRKRALTPEMVANDQLGAFANSFALLAASQDKTINDLAVDLLVSNPSIIEDSTALFHADHGNIVGSGGVPSAAQAKEMRQLMRRQTGIGTTDTIDAAPKTVLVPTELEDDAKQAYYTFEQLAESKVPTTDATLNVHRGTADVVVEGRLENYSTAIWYAFADPLFWACIKYVFQRGYENGQRRSWYDADRDTRYFGFEARLAVFVAGWRGAVRNPGS